MRGVNLNGRSARLAEDTAAKARHTFDEYFTFVDDLEEPWPNDDAWSERALRLLRCAREQCIDAIAATADQDRKPLVNLFFEILREIDQIEQLVKDRLRELTPKEGLLEHRK